METGMSSTNFEFEWKLTKQNWCCDVPYLRQITNTQHSMHIKKNSKRNQKQYIPSTVISY